MKECVVDIRDVFKCVLVYILGVDLFNFSLINESVVIVGNDFIFLDIV